jgi:hypothetical protein
VVLDGRTGLEVRTLEVAPYAGQLAVDATRSRAVILHDRPASGQSVSVVDPRSGATLRTIPLTDPAGLALDTATGTAVVQGDEGLVTPTSGTGWPVVTGTVSVLDSQSGAIRTTLAISSVQYPGTFALARDAADDLVFVVTAPPSGPHGVLVQALHAATGSLAWTTGLDLNASTTHIADAMDGRVLVGGLGQIAVLDARSGELMRTLDVDQWLDVLGSSTASGCVYALFQPPTDDMTGQTSPGEIEALDSTTGAVLAQVSLGNGADALAVDSSSEQTFTLMRDGLTVIRWGNQGQ